MPFALPSNLNPSFLIHIALEVPASLNFYLRPDHQLSAPAPQAHAVIRQYAVSLLSSSLVAAVFAFRKRDETSAWVAAALAVYHLAPLVRAAITIARRRAERGEEGEGDLREPEGPWIRAIVHAAALGPLLWEFQYGGK